VRFAFISEEKVAFPIAILCRVLAVSPSGYYASQKRPASLHARRDQDLSERIASIHTEPTTIWQSPGFMPTSKLPGIGWVGKRVARLMRENKLVARCRRRFRTTTDSKHSFPIAPNCVGAQLHRASFPTSRGSLTSRFCGTQQGWLYLAVILDLFPAVVGWATSGMSIATLRSRRLGHGPAPTSSWQWLWFHHSIEAAPTPATTTAKP